MLHTLIALLAVCSGIGHQESPGVISLISNGAFSTSDTASWVSNVETLKVIDANLPKIKKAVLAVFTTKIGGNPWDVGLHSPSTSAIAKGSKVSIRAWMRSPNSNKVSLVYEQAGQPFVKFINTDCNLTPEWKEYHAEGTADRDYDTNEAQLTLFLGYSSGSVELAGVRVETADLPAQNVSLVPSERLSNGVLSGWQPTGMSAFLTVSANQPKFAQAVQGTFSPKPTANPWDVSLHVPSIGKVTKNHTVYIRAWMRSATSARTSIIFERASEPFNKFVNEGFVLSPDWKEYRIAGIADGTYAPGETQLTIFLGYGSGSVEIGDVRAEDIGIKQIKSLPVTISYYSKKPSEAWRAPALARIEKFRKGDLSIRVVDRRGKPVTGASIRVDQIQQAFRFGTAAPSAWIADKTPKGEKFREVLGKLFNTITFENDLKWHQLAPESYSDVDTAYKWLDAHSFRVRGHNLVWGSYHVLPQGMKEMSNEQIVKAIHDRITEMVTRFKGKVYLWDVVNEAVTEHELWDRIGWEHFYDTYKRVRAIDPNVQLCYNDYNWTEEDSNGSAQRLKATELVKKMIASGTPLDVIGLQAHVSRPMTPMTRVIEITNEIARLGKPMEVTEYDLGVQDDKVNGEHMRDFLTAMYSVPQVQSFVMWGFWAGAHWRANEGGAMINLDWTPRPAAVAWEDLVKHQWWTHETVKTGSSGRAQTRVFFGQLRISVSRGGKTAVSMVTILPGKSGQVKVVL